MLEVLVALLVAFALLFLALFADRGPHPYADASLRFRYGPDSVAVGAGA